MTKKCQNGSKKCTKEHGNSSNDFSHETKTQSPQISDPRIFIFQHICSYLTPELRAPNAMKYISGRETTDKW